MTIMGALAYLCDDTRGDWGAAPGGNVYSVPVSDKDQFLNHHDGGSPVGLFGKSHAACLSRVKSIQSFHMNGRDWVDIGYNTLTCVHARLIEGRGVLTVGAQCPGYNRSGVGSQFMVGGSERPSQAMYDRQRKFYNDLQRLRDEEYMRKMGHRDGVATECPGDIIEQWVKNGMPASGISPSPTPTPVPLPGEAPGPHYAFPLPSADYWFGRDDGTRYSVSGYYTRTFGSKSARSWIQEFGSQMTRRGWNVGKGKTWLTTDGNNGYFGREYEALVKKVQDVANLRVDGRLGPKTWRWVFFAPVT